MGGWVEETDLWLGVGLGESSSSSSSSSSFDEIRSDEVVESRGDYFGKAH